MKKIYSILVLLFTVSLANATIWQVTVNASSFSPATVNALCGDTVGWILGSGSHTTTSTTIPACATAWNAPINATSPVYAIAVLCTGTYNYVCTPHGFTGMIIVTGTCASGVAVSVSNNYFSAAYPNPFSSKLTFENSEADMIALYNVVGEKIKIIIFQHGQTKVEVNAADLREGIYFYAIMKEGVVIETRKIVKK